MRETFPDKKPGDDLEADHVNKLSRVSRKQGTPEQGKYLHGKENAVSALTPFVQRVMIISTKDAEDPNNITYKVRPRYYDPIVEEWRTDGDENELDLDVDSLEVILGLNDLIIAWWDSQRGQYIPIKSGACDSQSAVMQITIFGSPTGGTFTMDWTLNDVKETLTFDYNDAASEVKTEMETHTELNVGDIIVAGTFPDSTMLIEFVNGQGLGEMDIPIPTADWSSLTGGSGLGVISSLARLGIE